MNLQVGDIVARRSYKCDLLFRIIKINQESRYAELLGEDVRLSADAPLEDLIIIDDQERRKRRIKEKEKEENCYRLFNQDYRLLRQKGEYEITSGYSNSKSYFELPGRVLHVDGDPLYLKKCSELYDKLKVPVYGVHIEEKEMPNQIQSLLEMVRPDILVITGHDAYLKNKGSRDDLKSYRNSKYFAQTIREARKVTQNLDNLVIFAGACQSHFEMMLKSGANFASSPERINIHALDPVYIVAKISLTPFMERVGVWDVLRNTLTGEKGLGGIETRGILRRGMPLNQSDIENNPDNSKS